MRLVLLSCLVLAAPALASSQGDPSREPDGVLLQRVEGLLNEVPLVDGHNDLPSSVLDLARGDVGRFDIANRQVELPADLPRLREGMVGGQFWSAYVNVSFMDEGDSLRQALTEIDMVHRIVERYDELEMALTADDVARIHSAGRIASLIGIEGGHAIEGSLATLRMLYRLGARYMTLTHFRTTAWADAATDFPRHDGLTEFGENVVREMNRLGMFVDLSHVSPESMRDALRVTRAPVIFSHSNAKGLTFHPRNVPDDVLGLVAENGGVVMVNFIPGYVVPTDAAWRERSGEKAERERVTAGRSADEVQWTARRDEVRERLRNEHDDEGRIERMMLEWVAANPAPRGTLFDVADHIDHIREVAGVDHVGVGSDFYDAGGPSMAQGLEDVTRFPNLFVELLRRGYTDEEVKKIAGLNLLRAMREMERVSEELRRSMLPLLDDLKPIGAR